MGPHHLLSQVDPLNDAAVKPKHIIEHPARAGRQHQGIDAVVGNVFFEKLNAFFAAQYRAGLNGQAFFLGYIAKLFDIQGLSNPTAFADIHTIFFIHG